MKERPILFNAPMVRAILDGSKTQTRRVLKKQPYVSRTNPPSFSDIEVGDLFVCPDMLPTGPERGRVIAECTSAGTYHCMGQTAFAEKHSPYGVSGDRLWVRETWSCDFANHYPCDPVWYAADDDRRLDIEVRDGVRGIYSPESGVMVPFRWRPSIHMPRWASRITLEITGVRVERLQDISYDDARAEGWNPSADDGKNPNPLDPKSWFLNLWSQINGPDSWTANPWVWVIEFKRVDGAKGA